MLLEGGERREGRPASALRLTNFTPDSTLPLVRARYGRTRAAARPNRDRTPDSRMECHRAGRAIAPTHQRARIVAEHREHDAAEVRKAAAMPSRQSSWRSCRNALTKVRRE